jgi:hypothetical protein
MRNKRGGTQLHLCSRFHYCSNLLGVGTLTLTIVCIYFIFLVGNTPTFKVAVPQ